MEFNRKIVYVGTSKGIIVPPDVLEYLEIDEGTDIVLKIEEGKHGKYFSVWKKE